MNIKIIPRSVHALLDYTWSGAFAASPKMFGFEDEPVAVKLCKTQGTMVAIASALTQYELGTLKIIPFRTHLKLDAIGAMLGIASPWLLGFSQNKRARNTILAFFLFEALAVVLSQTEEME